MARRPRHRRKDMRDAMKKKPKKPEKAEPEEDDADEVEEDLREAATKAIPRDRVEKVVQEAAAGRGMAESPPDDAAEPEAASAAPAEDEEPRPKKKRRRRRRSPEEDEPPGEDEDDDGEKRGAKTRKKKRRTRRPTADPDEVESLAEGFGTVTAVVGGTFALASLVILWKAFASSEEDLVGKPPYVWLMIQGVGATLAYTWLAVSGGGLSAGWSWAKTSINATAGFIVAISALDAFMVVAATGDSPEGAPQSTSVVFWAVMWGIYPIIALLFMNIPGLVGDVRLKGPQREEADEEEDEEPGEDEPEPEDGADEEGEAGEGDEEGEAVEDDEAPTKQITGGEFPAEEPEDEPQKES